MRQFTRSALRSCELKNKYLYIYLVGFIGFTRYSDRALCVLEQVGFYIQVEWNRGVKLRLLYLIRGEVFILLKREQYN